MYVYTTTTKIVFLVVIEHFSLFCRLSFLYDFKGVFDMVEKKTDRRILKTKRALRESLLYLLKEQPIQKISVSRLCEKSDINRSTFYTYYSSPMDLLESIEDEILNTLLFCFSISPKCLPELEFSEHFRIPADILYFHMTKMHYFPAYKHHIAI